jgi:hypothetical protein
MPGRENPVNIEIQPVDQLWPQRLAPRKFLPLAVSHVSNRWNRPIPDEWRQPIRCS